MLVRMAAGSTFPGHHHGGPEELFMLEGDCNCAGELLHVADYHRAKGQSKHGITSIVDGCLMLVVSPGIEILDNGKASDEKGSFFFMKADEGKWGSVADGITAKTLFEDTERKITTMLVRMAAGSTFPGHAHGGSEELYMLEGDCLCAGELLHVGDFHRAEGGSDHGVTSTVNGCTMLVISPKITVHN